MVVKDVDQPIPRTWFNLVHKDLGSEWTLPGMNLVTLFVGTLIRTLVVTRMSMMTGMITSQVLHRRLHPKMLLM